MAAAALTSCCSCTAAAAAASAAAAVARFEFHAPTLVGPGSGYASNFVAVSPTVFFGASLHAYLSTDSGHSWRNETTPSVKSLVGGSAGIVDSAFFRAADGRSVRNLGYDLQGVESCRRPCDSAPGVNASWYSCYTCFRTPWYASYETDAAGRPFRRVVNETTTFTGLPYPVSLMGDLPSSARGEHDLGRDGGGVSVLADGTLVLTTDVRWAHDRGLGQDGARLSDLTLSTNIIALRSTDGGRSFHYTKTLCDAARHRGCGECCNENDVVALPDGKSVMATWRMGAGDGLIWNKTLGINGSYHFYNHAVSTDGGTTFAAETPMHNMGCAKPRLLMLNGSLGDSGPDLADGGAGKAAPTPTAVVLGGGRLRNLGTSDVLLWTTTSTTAAELDGNGDWQEHSISYWHNQLAPPGMERFTPQMNSTREPRQSSSCKRLRPALTQAAPSHSSNYALAVLRKHPHGVNYGLWTGRGPGTRPIQKEKFDFPLSIPFWVLLGTPGHSSGYSAESIRDSNSTGRVGATELSRRRVQRMLQM